LGFEHVCYRIDIPNAVQKEWIKQAVHRCALGEGFKLLPDCVSEWSKENRVDLDVVFERPGFYIQTQDQQSAALFALTWINNDTQ
jgi:hypothetical protein